jgi:hypothetical protein
LYGFNLLVKTEASMKDGFDFKENRFFVEGESGIKYTYNNGHLAKDPKLASTSFLKALERIPVLIDNHKRQLEKASKDIPVLKEVVNSNWKKEDDLKKFKSDLSALDRKIKMTIGENSANNDIQNKAAISQNVQISAVKNTVEMSEPKAQFRV